MNKMTIKKEDLKCTLGTTDQEVRIIDKEVKGVMKKDKLLMVRKKRKNQMPLSMCVTDKIIKGVNIRTIAATIFKGEIIKNIEMKILNTSSPLKMDMETNLKVDLERIIRIVISTVTMTIIMIICLSSSMMMARLFLNLLMGVLLLVTIALEEDVVEEVAETIEVV